MWAISMGLPRRWFLGGIASLSALAGCLVTNAAGSSASNAAATDSVESDHATSSDPEDGSIDSSGVTAWSVGFGRPVRHSHSDSRPYSHGGIVRPRSQIIDAHLWTEQRTIYSDTDGGIWIERNDGSNEEIARLDRRIEEVCASVRDEWLVIEDETALWYVGLDALAADDPYAVVSDVRAPINELVPYWNPDAGRSDSEHGIVWAEYHTESDRDHYIWKQVRGPDVTNRLEPVLRVDSDEFRHFHSLDHDPFNPGHLWATAGDGDGQCRWYRSKDHGGTWERVEKPDCALYQTLRLNFTADHVYWAMDRGAHNPDAEACKFFRAERESVDDPEELAVLSAEPGLLSYGSAYLDAPVHGVFIGTRATERYDGDAVPMFLWDLDRERLHSLGELPIDFDLESRPGIDQTMPYQNADGTLAVSVVGVPTLQSLAGTQSQAFLDPRWIDLRIDRVVTDGIFGSAFEDRDHRFSGR